jgi:pyridoxamine 5'-phosphate oxidase
MNAHELENLRRDFARESLSKSSVNADPFAQFSIWMTEALASEIVDANAMTLSTVDAEQRPSSRVVLLKGFDVSGFSFFTNYGSRKGHDLAVNPNAVLHFFWPELERQVSVQGVVEKTTREESEAYFRLRPIESRLGAWASSQSDVIASREELEIRLEEFREKFRGNEEIPIPPFWGGYRLIPQRLEFWQGRPSRLHDRIGYELRGEAWAIFRLSP